jgi:glycosyltransferase involved in cell wall biosynthesis
MDISITIPVFNEEDNIRLLYDRLASVLSSLGRDSEIIFVDDGSKDASGAILDGIAEQDSTVKVIHLRRNYGQTAALMAAIRFSAGRIIIPMDADGQNDPTDIPRLLAKLEEGYDVVSGWRKKRHDDPIRRMLSGVANLMISRLLGVPLHDYGCTLKAYRREVIEGVRLYGEMHRFIPIYAVWEGGLVTEIKVMHHPRRFGRSKYGFGRIGRVALDLLILYFIDRAFDRPIQFFGMFGFFFLSLALLSFVWAVVLKYAFATSLIQTPLPLLAATMGLSGILFLLLGVIAEVQVRTYFESQGKPPFKIKSVSDGSARDMLDRLGRW